MLSGMQAGGNTTAGVVAKVENPTKNSKRITDWVKSIGNLQKVKTTVLPCMHLLVTPTGTIRSSIVARKWLQRQTRRCRFKYCSASVKC